MIPIIALLMMGNLTYLVSQNCIDIITKFTDMKSIRDFLLKSKALNQLPELKELLINYEQDRFKLYIARGSKIYEKENFTIFLFFFKDKVQQSAFYLKNNFPRIGNFLTEKAPEYVLYSSFEANWDLTPLDNPL